MIHDLYARFWDSKRYDVAQTDVDKTVVSVTAKADLMGLYFAKNRNRGREKLQELFRTGKILEDVKNNMEKFSKLGIREQTLELDKLPKGSHTIQIKFTLRKPYASCDDKDFYIIDNPITRDPAFKIPLIRSSSWKGALRWVSMHALYTPDPIVERLFGNQKEQQKAKQGRLFFYSTSLNQVSLDVITPLKRETRTPRRGPILIETAPPGSCGTFSLLYFPFDLLPAFRSGGSTERAKAISEMKEDLEVLKEAVPAMLLTYGFAAKKTSGYGVVEDRIDVCIDSIDMMKSNFEAYKNQINLLIGTLVSN